MGNFRRILVGLVAVSTFLAPLPASAYRYVGDGEVSSFCPYPANEFNGAYRTLFEYAKANGFTNPSTDSELEENLNELAKHSLEELTTIQGYLRKTSDSALEVFSCLNNQDIGNTTATDMFNRFNGLSFLYSEAITRVRYPLLFRQ